MLNKIVAVIAALSMMMSATAYADYYAESQDSKQTIEVCELAKKDYVELTTAAAAGTLAGVGITLAGVTVSTYVIGLVGSGVVAAGTVATMDPTLITAITLAGVVVSGYAGVKAYCWNAKRKGLID